MGNFFRRVFAFLLGMVFAVVLTLGGTAGFAYWAFKNLTLKDAGAEQENLGELNNLTIEEWVALYTEAQNNPNSFTFKTLEEYGFSTDDFIASLGVDVEKADEEDLELLREVAPLTLLSGETTNLPMAILFAFMPKDESGKYPIFSKHAREILRGKPLSILTEVDNKTQKPLIYSYINNLSIGAILSQNYEEIRDDATATYTYVSSEKRFDLFGNVKISVITDSFESGKEFNFGLEVNGGRLDEIGQMEAVEFLASLLTNTEEEFIGMSNSLNALSGMTVKGLFVFNEETNSYEFNAETLLSNLNIGKFMGYVKCTNDSDCKVDHPQGSTHDGKWYIDKGEEDELYTGEGISEDIMKNLFEVNLTKIMEGITDIFFLIDGVYLGKALGYHISSNPPDLDKYCSLDCDLHLENEEHEHNYYWLDKNDKYAGDMFNTLSNNSLIKVFTSGLDIDGMLSSTNIGGILGYTKCTGNSQTCTINHTTQNPCGSGLWFDANGNLISSNDIMGSIMSKLYDKKISELSTINLSDLLSGNYLGDMMGFTKLDKDGYCKVDCNISDSNHKHEYYWFDGTNFVGEVQNALSNISITSLLNGEKITVQGVLGDAKIGELMEFKFVDGNWVKADGSLAVSDDNIGKLLNKIYSKTIKDIESGTISQGLFADMRFGDFLGYVYDTIDSRWEDKNGVYVGKLYNEIANLSMEDAMSGGNIDIEGIVDSIELGEIFGYHYCDGSSDCLVHNGGVCEIGWYDSNNNKVVGYDTIHKIMLNIYGNTLSDLKHNQLEIGNIVQGLYLGEFLGYSKNESGDWVDKNNQALSKLNESLANILVSDLMNGNKSVESIVGDFYVGELMGYTLSNNTWYDKNLNEISNIERILAGKKLSQILNGELNILNEVNNLQLKDVVDIDGNSYLLNSLKEVKINELSTKLESLTLKDVVEINESNYLLNALKDVKISELSTKLETLTLKDVVEINESNYLLNALKDVKISELSTKLETLTLKDVVEINESNYLLNALKDVKISELSTKLETLTLGDVIEVKDSDYMLNNLKDIKLSELTQKFSTLTLKDVIQIPEGDALLNKLKDVSLNNLSSEFKNLTLSDVITSTTDNPLLNKLKNVKISELSTELDKLVLGDVIEITKDDYLLNNLKGVKLSELNQEFSKLTLSQVIEITEDDYLLYNLKDVKVNELSQRFKTLKVNEVFNVNESSTPQILKLLAGENINDLGSKMNLLKVGDISGYTLGEDNKWYKKVVVSDVEQLVLVDGINQKLANYTLQQISESGINTSDITLGDIFGNIEENSIFSLMYIGNEQNSGFTTAYSSREEVPVSEIASRISYGVKNASVGDLMSSGIISITTENQSTLTMIFMMEQGANAESYWKSLTMNELLNEILSKARQ